ncbi:hypothetical protein [Geodermatophilus sp. SYSU D00684]
MVFTLIGWGFSSCGDSSGEKTPVAEDLPSTDSGADGELGHAPPPTQPGTDGSEAIAEFLASRGVTESMIRQLGAKADATGYGLSPGTPLPFDQAQNFAAIMVSVCDKVTSGQTTWSAQIAEDVAARAPLADSQEMNGYLRDVFCPQLS